MHLELVLIRKCSRILCDSGLGQFMDEQQASASKYRLFRVAHGVVHICQLTSKSSLLYKSKAAKSKHQQD